MSSSSLRDAINEYIGDAADSEAKAQVMMREVPIGDSTLRNTRAGRYIPGVLLEKALWQFLRERASARQSAKVSAG